MSVTRLGLFFILILTLVVGVVGASPPQTSASTEYVVVYAADATTQIARSAIREAGGQLIQENRAVGVALVSSTNPNFLKDIAAQPALYSAMRNRPVTKIEPLAPAAAAQVQAQAQAAGNDEVEKRIPADQAAAPLPQTNTNHPGSDPLAGLQWDMDMIHANADGSYAVQPGRKQVLVAVIDSGIDGSHPDLAPNFDAALSRNFAKDMEDIDGPCEYPSCYDPPDVDNNGHGTHVAGIIGAALNGLGVSGIAPRITLVNIRGGQDSGYVFLQPVVDALVYSADIGVDVANMSFYIDPWLYNCPNNLADSPEAQMEQRTVIEATQRAVNYAIRRGVTLVAAAGNEHTDLGAPFEDASSPDYPPGAAYYRTVDNTCLNMPTEAEGVIAVSAIGPSKAKADYSNYGTEQTNFAAPGGYFRDFFGTPQYRQFSNLILSTYPKSVLEEEGALDADGNPLSADVLRDCKDGVCGYYVYLQGTSMASPHVTGVAALVVSQYGKRDPRHKGGLTLPPATVLKILNKSAADTACPEPPLMDYTIVGRPASYNALCEGTPAFNGFYGEGIIDAYAAVTVRGGPR